MGLLNRNQAPTITPEHDCNWSEDRSVAVIKLKPPIVYWRCSTCKCGKMTRGNEKP